MPEERLKLDAELFDLLIKAVRLEDESRELLEQIVGKAADPELRRLFETMLEEEKSHDARLKEAIKSYFGLDL
jgi:rubrerythrin